MPSLGLRKARANEIGPSTCVYMRQSDRDAGDSFSSHGIDGEIDLIHSKRSGSRAKRSSCTVYTPIFCMEDFAHGLNIEMWEGVEGSSRE